MTGPKTKTANYTYDEIESLVDFYIEMKPHRHKLSWLTRYCDLDMALVGMPKKIRDAVLLIGILGLDIRLAGKLMGVSPVAAWKRYRNGLRWLVNQLNGDE
jgi:DNA-directed RNA polymerase specialized sigma24 family protein